MLKLRRVLVAIVLFIPALCRGQETCLWMNAATAGGVLGGTVTATVSRPKVDISNAHTANAKSSAGPTSADPSGIGYQTSRTDDSDCSFVWHPGRIAAELHILVRTMSDPKKDFVPYVGRCGDSATPLKAIGNEAFACTLDGKRGKVVREIVGRVRDRVFVVRLSTNEQEAGNTLGGRTRKAADIVAGNLF
jgi:hypothetical protein